MIGRGTVKDLRECNRVLPCAKKHSDTGTFFSSEGPTWTDAVVVEIYDANFCNEMQEIGMELVGGRSQQGHVACLAKPELLNGNSAMIHPIVWSSTLIKRVCRSTLMAETFAMQKGTGQGARIRAAFVDARSLLDIQRWQETSSDNMSHVWVADYESLYEHLVSPKMNSVVNMRLAIDLSALRQLVWERDGERTQIVDSRRADCPRWIDTSTMIAEPLTKAMAGDRMMVALDTGVLDLQRTPESPAIKARSREARQNAKKAEQRFPLFRFTDS